MKNFQLNIEKLLKENDMEEANAIINQYENFVLSDIRTYFYKAVILLKQNKTEEAENILLQGISKSPLNYDYNYNYNLACLYEENKDYLKALDIYERLMTQVENIDTKKYLMDKINHLEKNYKELIVEQLKKDYSYDKKNIEIVSDKSSINLHLMIDNFYCKGFIEFTNKNFNKEEHVFLVLTEKENLEYLNPDDYENLEVIYLKPRWEKCMELNVEKILSYIFKSGKLFIHYLTDFICWLICRYNIKQNIYWLPWGSDLYRSIEVDLYDETTKKFICDKKMNISINNNYRNSIQYTYIKGTIRKTSYIITLNKGDYNLVRENFITNAKHLKFSYPNPVDFITLDKIIQDNDLKYNFKKSFNYLIQLGNSGDPANNHLEVLNMLKEKVTGNYGVIVPLSYGDKKYINELICEGKKILGERFIPLTEFMNAKEYFKVLKQVDIAIMNHNRQQGVGNILALLYLGKKVFLKENITTYEAFKNLGLEISCISDITNRNCIDVKEIVKCKSKMIERNKIIIKENYCEETLVELLNYILLS